MDIKHPTFRPDTSLDHGAMEELQREIARTATFKDRFEVDLRAVGDGTSQGATDTSGLVDTVGDDERPLVAGVDQAFFDDRAVSAVVVSRGGEVVERTHAVTDVKVPYVPGLLAFREGGPVLDALMTLEHDPDLLVVDGSGRIHFRQAGLATHIGVTVDIPSVGVAKNLLCGEPQEPVDGRPKGWKTPIRADENVESVDDRSPNETAPAGQDPDRPTVLGYAYQSRQYDQRPRINPLYVSPGHRMSAPTAVDIVERLCDGYKLPEPIRRADAYAGELRERFSDG